MSASVPTIDQLYPSPVVDFTFHFPLFISLTYSHFDSWYDTDTHI